MSSAYEDDLNRVTWSFSTLHGYEDCPYAFYLKKIEREEAIENFYAENGKVLHEIFADLLLGKIELKDAPARYVRDFKFIESKVRKEIMDNTFNACVDYLCACEDTLSDKYDVVWVEEKVLFKLEKYNFIGFVDLLLRDKETSELVLVDHKSMDRFIGKKGGVLKSREDSFKAYKHQMYLYCHAIKERFGVFPTKIVWHHFKDNGALTVIDFEEDEYNETIKWALGTIARIYKDFAFAPKRSFLMCRQLCGYREVCEYNDEEL